MKEGTKEDDERDRREGEESGERAQAEEIRKKPVEISPRRGRSKFNPDFGPPLLVGPRGP